MYKKHAGETCLLVGNGENLHQTPPAWFDYPAFGMNTIFKYEGWRPTYYTAVDNRVMREFGKEINEKYPDIPKFIPCPDLDAWQGENFYRFHHRAGELLNGKPIYEKLLDDGISYRNIMHVAMQIAAWMGFTTMLIIGMEHKPEHATQHFWGVDEGMHGSAPVQQWIDGYAEVVKHLKSHGINVLNLSPNTYVPDSIIPKGDYKAWINA